MNKPIRALLAVVSFIISIHLILSFTHEDYGRTTSLSNIKAKLSPNTSGHSTTTYDYDDLPTSHIPSFNSSNIRKANATFVILARNSDLDGTVRSLRDIEDRFNRRFKYPYVFLNEEEFTDEYKMRVTNIASGKVEFGVIPHDHWYQPDWIDEVKATAGRQQLVNDKVIYGGSVSYRNMCRFNSGFFFRHPLLQKYKWYWRVEPEVRFHCDVKYDPFLYMEDNNKVYGFVITMYEYIKTIPTLWEHTKDFINLHPEYVAKDNSMNYISENSGASYNLCHFWSNFEIASLDFWRSKEYTEYFDYLDTKGGFYYERWGDAPVHSLGVALFAEKSKIHFFSDIGYEHNPYVHCPADDKVWLEGRCSCDQRKNFDYDGYSCMKQWDRIAD